VNAAVRKTARVLLARRGADERPHLLGAEHLDVGLAALAQPLDLRGGVGPQAVDLLRPRKIP
jgi:hypothetical protein